MSNFGLCITVVVIICIFNNICKLKAKPLKSVCDTDIDLVSDFDNPSLFRGDPETRIPPGLVPNDRGLGGCDA